ncbi:MAG: KTSC domain-containing protein [Candidatus Paceibacterota bacterium]
MNELVEYAQLIISFLEQNGANLNVESQRALGDLLQNVLQVIQQQSGGVGEPPLTPPQPPGGEGLQEAMPSSNIEGFSYDDKTGKLLVRFLGKHPNKNGPIYGYDGVPANIADIFMRGAIPAKTNGKNKWGSWWQGKYPSMGAAMAHVIKAGGYPYRRVG